MNSLELTYEIAKLLDSKKGEDIKAIKVKELTALIDQPIALIDKQVSEFEAKQKAEKQEKIKEKSRKTALLLMMLTAKFCRLKKRLMLPKRRRFLTIRGFMPTQKKKMLLLSLIRLQNLMTEMMPILSLL